MSVCAYRDQTPGVAGGVACSGPVVITFHDQRGCFEVCFAHAKWRMLHSLIPGHSSSCPRKKVP